MARSDHAPKLAERLAPVVALLDDAAEHSHGNGESVLIRIVATDGADNVDSAAHPRDGFDLGLRPVDDLGHRRLGPGTVTVSRWPGRRPGRT